jgi:hypothetical protein
LAKPAVAEEEGGGLQLTEAELNKFNLLRIKVEGALQSARILELEQERSDREYVAQKHTRTQMIDKHRKSVSPLNADYQKFVRDIAGKYDLDPKFLGIDDETGVVHDMRPDDPVE